MLVDIIQPSEGVSGIKRWKKADLPSLLELRHPSSPAWGPRLSESHQHSHSWPLGSRAFGLRHHQLIPLAFLVLQLSPGGSQEFLVSKFSEPTPVTDKHINILLNLFLWRTLTDTRFSCQSFHSEFNHLFIAVSFYFSHIDCP